MRLQSTFWKTSVLLMPFRQLLNTCCQRAASSTKTVACCSHVHSLSTRLKLLDVTSLYTRKTRSTTWSHGAPTRISVQQALLYTSLTTKQASTASRCRKMRTTLPALWTRWSTCTSTNEQLCRAIFQKHQQWISIPATSA